MSNFKNSESILGVKWVGGTVRFYYSIDKDTTTAGQHDPERGLWRFENKILKPAAGKWEFAFVRSNDGTIFPILHYYHPKSGISRLDKAEYLRAIGAQLNFYNLYLVPGTAMRERGETKGLNVGFATKDEVEAWWDNGLQKIQLYQGKKLCWEYIKGKFKKIG
jgi:hypothetical protein